VPLYEYQCPNDGRFEVIRKFSDPPLTTCPTCGAEVQKLPSAPAIQFKGTGWYITDYARKGSGDAKAGGKESGKGESGKGESGKAESGKSESGKSESAKSESAKGDSGKSDSSSSSSTGTSSSDSGGSGKT
jgi:putative FmdB family regulatory protein